MTATCEGEGWANICKRGDQNFMQGRHYATTRVVDGVHTIDAVYKLEPDNTFQLFDFVSADSKQIRGTQVFLPLGAHVAKNSKKEESQRKPGLEIKWKTSKNNRNVFL